MVYTRPRGASPERLGPGLLGTERAIAAACKTNPCDVASFLSGGCKPNISYDNVHERKAEVQPKRELRRNAEEEKRMEAAEQERTRVMSERNLAHLRLALANEFRPHLLQQVLTHVQTVCGATGVYIGELKDEGKPTERIQYFAASAGHEFLLGDSLRKGEGITWQVFQKAPEPPPTPAAHEFVPLPPVELTEAPGNENAAVLFVRDVFEADPGMKFFRVPRPGQLFVVPIVFQSCAEAGSLVESVRNMGKGIAARKAFDEMLLSGGGEKEVKETKKDKKDKDKKKGKAAKAVQQEADDEETLDPERFFECSEYVEAPEAKKVVKWVLCVDTIGDQPRFSACTSSHALLEPDRSIELKHKEIVLELASFLAKHAAREAYVGFYRQRDYMYFHNKGKVITDVETIHAERDTKVESIRPSEKQAVTTTKKKDAGGKKKGKATQEAAGAQGDLSEEDKQNVRTFQLDACVAVGELTMEDILQKATCEFLPQPALDLLWCFFYGFLGHTVPDASQLTPEMVSRILTAHIPAALARLQHARPHAAPLPISGPVKTTLDGLPLAELAEVSIGLENLARWLKSYAELRDGAAKIHTEAPAPTDIRVTYGPPPEGVEDPVAPAFAQWIQELTGKPSEKIVIGQAPFKAEYAPPADATQHVSHVSVLLLDGAIAGTLSDEECEHIRSWVNEGLQLITVEDQNGTGVQMLNRIFEWQLAPAKASNEASVRSQVAHMYSLTHEDLASPPFMMPVGWNRPIAPPHRVCASFPRGVHSSPLTSASLPSDIIPIVESRVVDALVFPVGLGNVVISTLSSEYDNTMEEAVLLSHAPPRWSDDAIQSLAYTPFSGSMGEPEEVVKGAKPRDTSGRKEVFDRSKDIGREEMFRGLLDLYTWTQAFPKSSGGDTEEYPNDLAFIPHADGEPRRAKDIRSAFLAFYTGDTHQEAIEEEDRVYLERAKGSSAMVTSAKTHAGIWGNCLKFDQDASRLNVRLNAFPCEPMPEFPSSGEEDEWVPIPTLEEGFGWSVSLWFFPTRKAERNQQTLIHLSEVENEANLAEGCLSSFELRITPQERLHAVSGVNLGDKEKSPEFLQAERDGESLTAEQEAIFKKKCGTSEESIRYGDWNHVCVTQDAGIRYVYLNGDICDQLTHSAVKPTDRELLRQALQPGAEGQARTRPLHKVTVSGPLVPETPTAHGQYDVEPGTGRLPFRGMVGTLGYWERPLGDAEVKVASLRTRSQNMFHVHDDHSQISSLVGDENCEIAALQVVPRGNASDYLAGDGTDTRAFVNRGGSLLVFCQTQDDIDAVNRVFQQSFAVAKPLADANGACIASRKVVDDPWSHLLEECPLLVPRDGGITIDVKTLPGDARVLYSTGIVDVFTLPVGHEGRVTYYGYRGYTAGDAAAPWRNIFAKTLRGQTGYDL